MIKTMAITGGGGVLCGQLAESLGQQGYAIAVLYLKQKAADKVAERIINDGGKAIGVMANVLEKPSLELAKNIVNEKLGPVDYRNLNALYFC